MSAACRPTSARRRSSGAGIGAREEAVEVARGRARDQVRAVRVAVAEGDAHPADEVGRRLQRRVGLALRERGVLDVRPRVAAVGRAVDVRVRAVDARLLVADLVPRRREHDVGVRLVDRDVDRAGGGARRDDHAVHVAPPSSVMNRPRIGSVSCSAPMTATKTRLSSRGSMTIWPIVSPSSRPMFVHVAPPSVDL